MEKAPRRIKAAPDSELVNRIKEAISDGVALVVEAEDERYSLYPKPARVTAVPKSRRMKGSLLSLAGVWSDLDADDMIERLYRARRESPPSKPIKA